MNISEKFDKLITGIVSGAVFPAIIGLIIFAFTAHGKSLNAYLERISSSNIIIHAITLCVFPNLLIFLLFTQFDMLRAARGVLYVTVAYAMIVFLLKLF
jgi:hypothetical protein